MRHRVLTALGLVAALLLMPAVAVAHPLGNFTVSTSAGIVLSPGSVRIDYVVDLAEIPTVQVMPGLDRDDDGAPSEDERAAWAWTTARELVSNLSVAVGGDPVALGVVSANAELLAGQGGLDVLRLEVVFDGRVPEVGEIAFHDANFSDRLGWHEVTASGSGGSRSSGRVFRRRVRRTGSARIRGTCSRARSTSGTRGFLSAPGWSVRRDLPRVGACPR